MAKVRLWIFQPFHGLHVEATAWKRCPTHPKTFAHNSECNNWQDISLEDRKSQPDETQCHWPLPQPMASLSSLLYNSFTFLLYSKSELNVAQRHFVINQLMSPKTHQKTRSGWCYLCSAPPQKSMQLQGCGRGEISVKFNQSVSLLAFVFPYWCVYRSSLETTQTLLLNCCCFALLEFPLYSQIRVWAHTCLVRPNADLFMSSHSSGHQCTSNLTVLMGKTEHW